MACPFNLFSRINNDPLLGPPDTTGTWVPGQPVSGNCANIVNANPAALPISGGHLGTLDVSGAIPGTYYFTYSVGGGACIDCTTVTVTINPEAQITANSIYCTTDVNGNVSCSRTFCDGDNTAYNLYSNFVNGTPTTGLTISTATGAGYVPGTSSATDDTFNPDVAGPGSYTFTFTLNNGDGTTPIGCTDCVKTAVINITVDSQPNAGIGQSVTLCNAG